eukprot:3399308-Pyramimonas_sp.AAC.1
MSAALYGIRFSDLHDQTLITASGDEIPGASILQKHALASIPIIPISAGFPGVTVQCAVFEHRYEGGDLFVDVIDLARQ